MRRTIRAGPQAHERSASRTPPEPQPVPRASRCAWRSWSWRQYSWYWPCAWTLARAGVGTATPSRRRPTLAGSPGIHCSASSVVHALASRAVAGPAFQPDSRRPPAGWRMPTGRDRVDRSATRRVETRPRAVGLGDASTRAAYPRIIGMQRRRLPPKQAVGLLCRRRSHQRRRDGARLRARPGWGESTRTIDRLRVLGFVQPSIETALYAAGLSSVRTIRPEREAGRADRALNGRHVLPGRCRRPCSRHHVQTSYVTACCVCAAGHIFTHCG
jgi:hypothetical protein